ncbi:MAG: AMP-binding protein, partial [Anaerolineae bacterium]|nr:AMP-binding protein [Anaerolineae bacterium]
MHEQDSGLAGMIVYNKDLYTAETIRQLTESFKALLYSVTRDPDQFLGEYSVLSESQKKETLQNINNVVISYRRDSNVCELFEDIVTAYPDRVAFLHHDEHITYKSLNTQANRLAHFLRSTGVLPGTPVGLCTDRCSHMVIGILGIIKAGGCYVPIDPSDPAQRIALLIEETELQIVLTHDAHMQLFLTEDIKMVALDTQWREITCGSQDNLEVEIDPQNPLYIMYTSGSTGMPKGIVIPHRAVVCLVRGANYTSFSRNEVIAQGSTIAFDAATFELWGALLNGGKLVILDKDILLSPRKHLEETINSYGITSMFLTTALFNAVARNNPHAFASLRQLLFGGETATAKWVREVLSHKPPARLLHMYGPSETTTFASWYLVKNIDNNARTVPIGSPISNTQLYVVDHLLQPLPVGAV